MPLTETLRECTKCKSSLTLDSFGKDSATRDGLKLWCKVCRNTYFREWRGRPETKKKQSDWSRKFRYGITKEQYQELFKRQNGLCAICPEPETCLNNDGSVKSLSVDHDHNCCNTEKSSCGKCIRGLLCAGCNRGIGYLKDNPDILINAATYLMGYDSRQERGDDLSL